MSVSSLLRLNDDEEGENADVNVNVDRLVLTSAAPMSQMEAMLMQLTQTLHGMDDRQRRMDERQRNMDERQRNMDERVEEMGGSMGEMIGRVREVVHEQEEVRRYFSGQGSDYSGRDNPRRHPERGETGMDQLGLYGSGKESHMNDNGINEVSKVVSEEGRSQTNLGPETNRIADNSSAAPPTADLVRERGENRPSRSKVRCSERLRGKNRRDYTTLDRVGFLSPRRSRSSTPGSRSGGGI
jgi:hypothetical protein